MITSSDEDHEIDADVEDLQAALEFFEDDTVVDAIADAAEEDDAEFARDFVTGAELALGGTFSTEQRACLEDRAASPEFLDALQRATKAEDGVAIEEVSFGIFTACIESGDLVRFTFAVAGVSEQGTACVAGRIDADPALEEIWFTPGAGVDPAVAQVVNECLTPGDLDLLAAQAAALNP